MPELPEVETVVRGLAPLLVGQKLVRVAVRQPKLRFPVPVSALKTLRGRTLCTITRRAKYLLFEFDTGTLIGHLGMTGSFRFCNPMDLWQKHDHVQLQWGCTCIRYQDPRRFGALLWQKAGVLHPLLAALGPEPLSGAFNAESLQAAIASRGQAIKSVIMDARVVVGVGNIYASEACFLAGIAPATAAKSLTSSKIGLLATAIKQVLSEAIAAGGTTIRDFQNAEAMPGYFARDLHVYGRAGKPCHRCKKPIRRAIIGQRSTFWCPVCQK